MKFKKPKVLVAERIKEEGFEKPKILFRPTRGDTFNRVAYKLVKGELSFITPSSFGETIKPGTVLDEQCGVSLLGLLGEEIPDSGIIRKGKSVVDFSNINFRYPTIAVDFSLYEKLSEKEKKSLFNQIEISFGIVKDYFTPENFVLSSCKERAKEDVGKFFHPFVPFQILEDIESDNVIVLDSYGDKEFTHEEVDADTVIVVGGIVDSGERMDGWTKRVLENAKHRRITYKGSIKLVPDRINDIIKIVCEYLTEEISLEKAVRRNFTRTSKLKWLRKALESSVYRFVINGEVVRGIPESLYDKWKEEFLLTDFHFRKGAKHIGGFVVFKDTLLSRVKGKIKRRGKEILILGEIKDGDIIKIYS